MTTTKASMTPTAKVDRKPTTLPMPEDVSKNDLDFIKKGFGKKLSNVRIRQISWKVTRPTNAVRAEITYLFEPHRRQCEVIPIVTAKTAKIPSGRVR